MYEFLLVRQNSNGSLRPRAVTGAAKEFGTSTRTVQRLWKKAIASLQNGCLVAALSPNRKGRCGRKKKELDEQAVRAVPLSKRKTIRSLADALKIPSSTLFDRLKEKKLRRHSSSVRPLLTESNKQARVEYCKAAILPASITAGEPTFKEFNDVVHVDEKWFYLTEESTSSTCFLMSRNPTEK